MSQNWTIEDGVALRDFLARVPAVKLKSVLSPLCPAVLDAETLLAHDAQAVSRVAAMKAGWDACVDAFIELGAQKRPASPDANYRDMQ